jgi:hypothetical protein
MSFKINGVPQLNTRFEAIKPNPEFMRTLALHAVAEQKKLSPVKTGNLRRTIGIGSVTATLVETIATANYALFVELGTRAHDIVPRFKKALRFKPKNAPGVVYAKRVRHPGTRPQPFMLPGAQNAVRKAGFKDIVVKQWNDAA